MLHFKTLPVSAFFCLCLIVSPPCVFAQSLKGRRVTDTLQFSPQKIKQLSVEELMNIEVTSVSKRPEKLSEVASAIQVITNEDIRRSGATNLPEALKLSPNLHVAQYNAYAWIISARGFNNVFANKLLVMIDGRTVYSPLFAGVFWDAQYLPLEAVDRIEVISGPGGTLWGANAVNGVINIITKKAKDTQGLYLSAAAGGYLNNQVSARYGGQIGKSLNYRFVFQRNQIDNTLKADGQNNTDDWNVSQGQLRVDWDAGGANKFSFQSSVQGGNQHTNPGPSSFDAQNALGVWLHRFSSGSELQVQAYYDRMWRRDIPGLISDQMQTYDIDMQHRFGLGKSHNILWGGGYRLMLDNSINATDFVGFVPAAKNLRLYSSFVQDEIQLSPDALKLTLGTKLLHNVYSGFEWQPSARLSWTPAKQQTVWAAVSRAVRTPSRIDVDYHIPTYPVPPNTPNVGGGPNFVSEKLIAYEIGYRIQPNQKASISIATYYNVYNDLYSVEVLPGTQTYLIQNGMEGNSQGIEVSGFYQLLKAWRVRGGYTFFHKNIRDKPGHSFDTTYAGTDPQHQAVLQSMVDLTKNFQLDITGRYVSSRPLSVAAGVPFVAAYSNLDIRLAWHSKWIEVSVVAQNMANRSHVEFASNRIPRSIYSKIVLLF
nr:TonB-dependent receptor [uncultured Mucilaginibacter sp.]